jgi:ATP-dependent 26S proteasome regulatory subunit
MGQKLVLEIENMISNEKKKKKEEIKTDTLNEKFEKLDLNKSLIFNESNLKPIDSNLFDKNVSLYLIDQKTSVKIINISDDEKTKNMENLVMFKDVGGLKDEIKKLKQLFINPFEFSNIYKNLGNYFLKKLR